jgi:hypothetical protein
MGKDGQNRILNYSQQTASPERSRPRITAEIVGEGIEVERVTQESLLCSLSLSRYGAEECH